MRKISAVQVLCVCQQICSLLLMWTITELVGFCRFKGLLVKYQGLQTLCCVHQYHWSSGIRVKYHLSYGLHINKQAQRRLHAHGGVEQTAPKLNHVHAKNITNHISNAAFLQCLVTTIGPPFNRVQPFEIYSVFFCLYFCITSVEYCYELKLQRQCMVVEFTVSKTCFEISVFGSVQNLAQTLRENSSHISGHLESQFQNFLCFAASSVVLRMRRKFKLRQEVTYPKSPSQKFSAPRPDSKFYFEYVFQYETSQISGWRDVRSNKRSRSDRTCHCAKCTMWPLFIFPCSPHSFRRDVHQQSPLIDQQRRLISFRSFSHAVFSRS